MLVRAGSVQTSNIHDHAFSEQHTAAMNLLKREQAVASTNDLSFVPIVQAFTSLSEDERGRLQHKFDIAYFIAIEKLSLAICKSEAHHGENHVPMM